MAYEFTRLSAVEALTEVPEGANALIEIDGTIKRVPGSGLGGATGIKTAIIKDNDYDNTISGTMSAATIMRTYECTNMTFNEAYQTMASGEPLAVFGMFSGNGAVNTYGTTTFIGTLVGVPCIALTFELSGVELFWTANGVSAEAPEEPK